MPTRAARTTPSLPCRSEIDAQHSGDYERSFVKDGVRYHHLIDPDRGVPAGGCRSVTIVARSATTADVLSTGVFIMGPSAGMALIEKLPDVEGVIVTASNEVLVSSGLKGRVEIKGRRPTRHDLPSPRLPPSPRLRRRSKGAADQKR